MIRYAGSGDCAALHQYDCHIAEDILKKRIEDNQVIVALEGERLIGWLRYSLFWDNIPFMNLLYLLDAYRGNGYGTRLVRFWEQEMAKSGYRFVLTSTQSNETAQFFYRKNGYVDTGSLILPGEPLEILLYKRLN